MEEKMYLIVGICAGIICELIFIYMLGGFHDTRKKITAVKKYVKYSKKFHTHSLLPGEAVYILEWLREMGSTMYVYISNVFEKNADVLMVNSTLKESDFIYLLNCAQMYEDRDRTNKIFKSYGLTPERKPHICFCVPYVKYDDKAIQSAFEKYANQLA